MTQPPKPRTPPLTPEELQRRDLIDAIELEESNRKERFSRWDDIQAVARGGTAENEAVEAAAVEPEASSDADEVTTEEMPAAPAQAERSQLSLRLEAARLRSAPKA